MPQVDARPAGLDALSRPGNPISWTLTFPAGYLTGKTFSASVGGTAVTPSIVGDVMTVALTGAQTTALGTGRHAFILTDSTGDDAVRIAGRLMLTESATGSPDTDVTITVDNTVSVTVTILGTDAIASVNGQVGVVVLDATDVGADASGSAAAAQAAAIAAAATDATTKANAKVSDTAYDATSWDGVTSVAPSKNAVRDKFESLSGTYLTLVGGEPVHSRYTGLGSVVNAKLDPHAFIAPTVAAALSIATGYTGNDIVEPMVLFDATAPFLGYEYVLCAAPYYTSSAVYENPCLWVSHDGTTWDPVVNGVATPAGTVTPIVPNAVQGDGNLSDPYIVRGPDGAYYILWNQNLNGSPGTGDGSHDWSIKGVSAATLAGPWSTPVSMIRTALATDRPASPSMFWDGRQWVMYCIDLHSASATTITKYTNPNANPLAGTWTKQTNPSITMPTPYATQVWWHLNAYRIGTQHVLLIQDNASGSSAGGNIWLVTSDDQGATFTVPQAPLLETTTGYRSAIVPMFTPAGWALDLFYGVLSTNWQLRRTTAVGASSGVARWKSGYYYGPQGPRSTGSASLDREFAVPLDIPAGGVSVDRIGVTITTAGSAGGVARLGIRRCNPDGTPGTLLLEAGSTIATDSTGDKEVTISQKLFGQRVWLTIAPQGGSAATYRVVTSQDDGVGDNAISNAGGSVGSVGYQALSVTGALPKTYGLTSSVGPLPRIYVRAV